MNAPTQNLSPSIAWLIVAVFAFFIGATTLIAYYTGKISPTTPLQWLVFDIFVVSGFVFAFAGVYESFKNSSKTTKLTQWSR